MAEFDEKRAAFDKARRARAIAAEELFLASERVQRGVPEAEEDAKLARNKYEAAVLLERQTLSGFAAVSDPRDAIAHFRDEIPILLFPVRLETRFSTGRAGEELLVRIYPDDCSIDTFDATLSETEVLNAKLYWTTMWEAGGDENAERGAWRGLVAAHGAGRAEWIIRNYFPAGLGLKPSKTLATDVILTIPTEVPLSDEEAKEAAIYWCEIWLADGDAKRGDDARAVLEGNVGADRAAAIISDFVPANIAHKPAAPLTKSTVTLSLSFVVFPDSSKLDLKRHSWARAPFARALPDRFLFIGYADGQPPLTVLGAPVNPHLIVGPDPSLPKEQQMQHGPDGDILFPDEMRWMVDFGSAVAHGMGIRVPLGSTHTGGFERVLVVGIRASSDDTGSKQELETLLDHHYYGRNGFELVAQGTPTNNTESESAGRTRGSDADASFDDRKNAPLFADESDWLEKRDGQWLAEVLGIDAEPLRKVHNSGGRDQADARAMNVALWPGTLGYWMETMLGGVFEQETIEETREFFNRFVLGRGTVPAIRIGKQPYGILPTTAFSRMDWLESGQHVPRRDHVSYAYLRKLHPLLQRIDDEWRTLSGDVSHTGKSGDAHKILLDIVGLHSGSVEYSQRYAESVQQLYNRLSLEGLGGLLSLFVIAALQQTGVDLLKDYGYSGTPPDILGKFFLTKHNPLRGPLIDDRPLSETEAIREYTTDKKNYLQWLIDAARTSIDAVYAQKGFKDDRPPRALLYLMLRHAMQLGYHDVSVRLHEAAGLFTRDAAVKAKRDEPFVHISERTKTSESRYQLLYKSESAITGSPNVAVADYIASSLGVLVPARYLREQIEALEKLKDASTARLERAFAEHIDTCSYRVDSWLLGFVHHQLGTMRNIGDRYTGEPRQGIYLGAYAWLENLKRDTRKITGVRLTDPELIAAFEKDTDPPLRSDSTNQGYIHAPSLNHAVAAAVLRNGYISDASPANRQTMAVNLTSERVRASLAMLEGIRGGQTLAALLGYQFERGLHDRWGLAEVDKFIYDLRQAFPLVAKMQSTRATDPDVPVTAKEARNVIDGLAFVNHMKATGSTTYPFGKTLPFASDAEKEAMNLEAARLLEIHDAVADVALAEGVYQAVLGNYDRVASTLDAYSKGNFPPEPQVVQTPVSGIGLTHRVALHLEPGLDPAASPIAGVTMTPRAQAEPAINQWLFGILPPLDEVACKVTFRDATTNTIVDRQVTLRDLAVQPADVLRLVSDDTRQHMSELDDRITRFILTTESPRPDTPLTIQYMETTGAPYSIFQLMPLVRQLRRLTQSSRPLQATDLALANEAKTADDAAVSLPRKRIDDIRTMLVQVQTDLAAFIAPVSALVADPVANRNAIIAGVDAWGTSIAALLERASAFAIPQTGSGFVLDFRQRFFSAIFGKAAALVTKWDERLIAFDALITEYAGMGAADNHAKYGHLARAERLIATTSTIPRPATADALRDELVNVKRPVFVAKRNELDAVASSTHTAIAPLLADVQLIPPIAAFDTPELTFADEEESAIKFAEDLVRVAGVVAKELDRRAKAAANLLTKHDAAAAAVDRVRLLTEAAKELVGKEVVLVPEFPLKAADGDAIASSLGGDLLQYLHDTVKTDFPVDTWLYGVARVREKMRSWEDVVMLAGAFDRAEPELTPVQVPFFANDRWLALEFPPDAKIDTDRLLYTAHFAKPFDKTKPQCGLLLDEWSEVIPAAEATTGVAFHYDRPNSEAPQTMLLVTPSQFRGAWQWNDLVDALNETLDLAKRRAVEPVHFESNAYARFLPATIMAVTMRQLSISANLAYNNDLVFKDAKP